MSEAPELDQGRPDAEIQAGCQQNVHKEPSPKEGTHWIDEILKAVPQTPTHFYAVATSSQRMPIMSEYFLAVEHGAAALIFKPALA
jgi:hypothetical protein